MSDLSTTAGRHAAVMLEGLTLVDDDGATVYMENGFPVFKTRYGTGREPLGSALERSDWKVYTPPKLSPEERFREFLLDKPKTVTVTLSTGEEYEYHGRMPGTLSHIRTALEAEAIEGSGITVSFEYEEQGDE